jgi:two-component system phosphate regulon sensor histidine kinase PhoR
VRELGFQSYMCVPLVTRGEILGVISFVSAESGRRYGPDDLALAEELARRAGTAVENAQLYREVEERAQAARVLETIGDGVCLVDDTGVVRLWNRAAEAITGVRRDEILGRRLEELLPGWGNVSTRAETLPLEREGRERWVSISGVAFAEGVVHAFHDTSEEHALEQIRQDLVATVSHELRTPLAAIYGSALTLNRGDLELQLDIKEKLLNVIVAESARLTGIVNDLLLASQLDAGRLEVHIESCDPRALTESVVEAARTHLPEGVRVELQPIDGEVPAVAADEVQLRQVLDNLLDNAVKYSPAGGAVELRVEAADDVVRFAVADTGLGIPTAEQSRIFEKFYRLDPDMTGGIGGTGLGLYIARELVRRVDGRIWVEPNDGPGSVFWVEIPAAAQTGEKPRQKVAARP